MKKKPGKPQEALTGRFFGRGPLVPVGAGLAPALEHRPYPFASAPMGKALTAPLDRHFSYARDLNTVTFPLDDVSVGMVSLLHPQA